MLSVMAVSSAWTAPSSMMFALSNTVSKAKPNSPPMAITIPVRNALRRLRTNRHETRNTISALTSNNVTSSSSTSGSCVMKSRRSSSIPTETKNSPSKRFWKGLMTASVW